MANMPKLFKPKVVCKFKVVSVLKHEGLRRARNADGSYRKNDVNKGGGYIMEPCMSGTVKMSPVFAGDNSKHENSLFWDATPSGELTLQVNNLAAVSLLENNIGKEFYVEIKQAA